MAQTPGGRKQNFGHCAVPRLGGIIGSSHGRQTKRAIFLASSIPRGVPAGSGPVGHLDVQRSRTDPPAAAAARPFLRASGRTGSEFHQRPCRPRQSSVGANELNHRRQRTCFVAVCSRRFNAWSFVMSPTTRSFCSSPPGSPLWFWLATFRPAYGQSSNTLRSWPRRPDACRPHCFFRPGRS
jgi:hypothetical protein